MGQEKKVKTDKKNDIIIKEWVKNLSDPAFHREYVQWLEQVERNVGEGKINLDKLGNV